MSYLFSILVRILKTSCEYKINNDSYGIFRVLLPLRVYTKEIRSWCLPTLPNWWNVKRLASYSIQLADTCGITRKTTNANCMNPRKEIVIYSLGHKNHRTKNVRFKQHHHGQQHRHRQQLLLQQQQKNKVLKELFEKKCLWNFALLCQGAISCTRRNII